MYFTSEDEISWPKNLYPQYQIYEHRLNTLTDRSWPISLHQIEVTLAEVGLFYSGNVDIVFCAFCVIHLCRWLPKDNIFTEHKKFNKNCKFSFFQDINHQSTIQYLGLYRNITLQHVT